MGGVSLAYLGHHLFGAAKSVSAGVKDTQIEYCWQLLSSLRAEYIRLIRYIKIAKSSSTTDHIQDNNREAPEFSPMIFSRTY